MCDLRAVLAIMSRLFCGLSSFCYIYCYLIIIEPTE